MAPFLVGLVVGLALTVVMVPLIVLATLRPVLLINRVYSVGESAAAGSQRVNVSGAGAGVVGCHDRDYDALDALMLRATLTQDFAKAFDVRFMKRYLALTWREAVLATLSTFMAGMVLTCLGALAFCIGMYCAAWFPTSRGLTYRSSSMSFTYIAAANQCR